MAACCLADAVVIPATYASAAQGVAGTNAQARVATAEIAITNRYTKGEADAAFATAAQGVAATNAQARVATAESAITNLQNTVTITIDGTNYQMRVAP